jgi:cyclase
MARGMIIGRLRPGVQKGEIIRAFQESDETELPGLIGVHTRSIFLLGDIYVHLVESTMPLDVVVNAMKDHPLYMDIKQNMDQYVEPLSPDLHPGIAEEIYCWNAEQHISTPAKQQ